MAKHFYYIPNTDGSIRWIWPLENRKASFLHFYPNATFKQKLFRLIVSLLFQFGWQKFAFSKTDKIELDELPSTNEWALFYGTIGPNNKKVLYYVTENGEPRFVKIASTSGAQKLMDQEKEHLVFLNGFQKRFSFELPEVIPSEFPHRLELEALSFQKSASIWMEKHTKMMNELSSVNSYKNRIGQWLPWHQISHRISELSHLGSAKIPVSILNKLILLKMEIDRNKMFEFHWAHGDFTPWNSFLTAENKLAAIDWELANEHAPKGSDFFHFHIQNGILVDRKPASSILANIQRIGLEQKLFTDLQELNLYLKLHLLQHISYYALLYAQQPSWHVQVHWQLKVWEELLNEVITLWNDRKLFISDFFEFMKSKKYAGLKLHSGRPEDLNEYSDMDLVVRKEDIPSMVKWMRSRGKVHTVLTQKRSNMTVVTLLFQDGTRLYLDLIVQLKRRNLEFMDANKVLNEAKINSYGIKEVNLRDTALYVGLFYGLNGSAVPKKFAKLADNLLPLTSDLAKAVYKHYYNEEGSVLFLKKLVGSDAENSGFTGSRNRLTYAIDTFRSLFKRRGMIITLSGVDGAGKTTVIEELKYELDKKYRRPVVVLRHRPSLVPILSAYKYGKEAAEQKSINSLPRQGSNRSFLASMLRFAYYYSDYFVGQFYVYFKYVMRGYIVIYDRYYFDIINDSKRSNMTLPKPLTRIAYIFLMKPNFNFFLYAQTDTILERKRELDRETIEQLTHEYKNLFKRLQGRRKKERYVSIDNEVLSQTKQRIFKTIGPIY